MLFRVGAPVSGFRSALLTDSHQVTRLVAISTLDSDQTGIGTMGRVGTSRSVCLGIQTILVDAG